MQDFQQKNAIQKNATLLQFWKYRDYFSILRFSVGKLSGTATRMSARFSFRRNLRAFYNKVGSSRCEESASDIASQAS